jgi:hypothetical protein
LGGRGGLHTGVLWLLAGLLASSLQIGDAGASTKTGLPTVTLGTELCGWWIQGHDCGTIWAQNGSRFPMDGVLKVAMATASKLMVLQVSMCCYLLL